MAQRVKNPPAMQESVQSLSCVRLCDPMDFSTPGLPVHHQLLELAQTHVPGVGDAIQPSHPLSPLLLLPSVFSTIRVFSNELVLNISWPKYWNFSFNISPSNEYSGLISCRINWFSRQECWSGLKISRGSSQPRDQTPVSHIAGRFFTVWATREAPKLLLVCYYLTCLFFKMKIIF